MRLASREPGDEHRKESAKPYESGEDGDPDVGVVVVEGHWKPEREGKGGAGRRRHPFRAFVCTHRREVGCQSS